MYDLLGQLTRVNAPKDTASGSTGTTWVYTYDRGGNLLNKKRYAYTTGTLGSVLQTISYTYGDSNWKDKLTAYNGAAIAYDAIGNPTSDGTWTYAWANGRQLASLTKSGTTASFTYNEDGLRVQKNVNGTVTNYLLHGSNVVHLTQGSNTLHFFYGADGTPAVVELNGVSYGYVKNLQGDIIAIVNASGATVVQYTYDAWGKLLSKTGSMASTLGTLNPFRYRGYVYDEETGLYYLRSRYYNPNWCRFVNADDRFDEHAILKFFNIFAYCFNNPIHYFDPSGHGSLENLLEKLKMLFTNGHGSNGKTDCYYYVDCDIAANSSLVHGGIARTGYSAYGVPNPGGRLGSQEHRNTINDVAERYSDELGDVEVVKEMSVDTPNGTKTMRYPDITILQDKVPILYVQVGVMNKNGTPVSREVHAIVDISEAKHIPIVFVPYKQR